MSEDDGRLQPNDYRERSYRELPGPSGAVFEITIGESDLWISCSRPGLRETAYASLLRHRRGLENFLDRFPEWGESLVPVAPDAWPLAPGLARRMMAAAAVAGVGPMAAVAGAVAEAVGRDLLQVAEWVVVENGGDIFLAGRSRCRLAIFAGDSPLSGRLGIELKNSRPQALGVCTSSASIGHSLSLGRADAVTIVAENAALADAVATAMGNLVQEKRDLARVVKKALELPGVAGAVAILDDDLAAGGDLELVELS
jgi:ApbE superfamily uncharacterized protein (UPF0280 family)